MSRRFGGSSSGAAVTEETPAATWEDRVRSVLASGVLPTSPPPPHTEDLRGATGAQPYSGGPEYAAPAAPGIAATQVGPFHIQASQTNEVEAYARQELRARVDYVMRFVTFVAGRKARNAEDEYTTSEYVLFKQSYEKAFPSLTTRMMTTRELIEAFDASGGDDTSFRGIAQCGKPWDFLRTWCPRLAASAETAYERFLRNGCDPRRLPVDKNEILRHPDAWQAWAIATYVVEVQTSYDIDRGRHTRYARQSMPVAMFGELATMRRVLQRVGWARDKDGDGDRDVVMRW